MIILDEKYAITADTNCWQLCTKEVFTDNKTGEKKERYAPFKYFGTIERAVSRYIDIRQKELINSKDYNSISKALADLKKLQKEITEKIDL